MTIAHLSYVMCDVCGNPAQAAGDHAEARAQARREGYVRLDGRDLCVDHRPDADAWSLTYTVAGPVLTHIEVTT